MRTAKRNVRTISTTRTLRLGDDGRLREVEPSPADHYTIQRFDDAADAVAYLTSDHTIFQRIQIMDGPGSDELIAAIREGVEA